MRCESISNGQNDIAFLVEGLFLLIVVVLSLFVSSHQLMQRKQKKMERKDCMELYKAIILFTKLSDKEWKQKNEQKGSFYASTAADYTIIYSTFCTK